MAIAIARQTLAQEMRCVHPHWRRIHIEAPVATVLDLWYARHDTQVQRLTTMALARPDLIEDWLDRNMAAVLQGMSEVVTYDYTRHQHVHPVGALELVVAFDRNFGGAESIDFVVRPARLRYSTPSITLEHPHGNS